MHVTAAGRASLYAGNRAHVAWPAVEILAGLRQALTGRIAAEVSSWPLAPASAALFGSAARGDGATGSDIDILLIRRDDADEQVWQHQADVLREHVHAWTGNRCQLYDLTGAELAAHVAAGEPIVAAWLREAVVLYGPPLRQLIRHAAGMAR